MDRRGEQTIEAATHARRPSRDAARHSRRHGSWLVALALGAALLVAACGGGDDDAAIVRTTTPTATPTASATPTSTATATRTATPTPTETPEPTPDVPVNIEINSLDQFVETYGYPSTATYATIRIPRFGVEAQVSAKRVGDGASIMPNPNGPAEVAYYDMSAWTGLGGEPGAGGNAIFSGHLDYSAQVGYAGVRFHGQAVFAKLGDTRPGDLIEVEYQGQTLQYEVVWLEQVNAGVGTNWASIWSSDVGADAITLYTCGGTFDTTARSYDDRVVVRAHRVG
jgi:hypothetical protein